MFVEQILNFGPLCLGDFVMTIVDFGQGLDSDMSFGAHLHTSVCCDLALWLEASCLVGCISPPWLDLDKLTQGYLDSHVDVWQRHFE
jgi:hypothetical protein